MKLEMQKPVTVVPYQQQDAMLPFFTWADSFTS